MRKIIRMSGWIYQLLLSPRFVRIKGRSKVDFSVAFQHHAGTIDIGANVQIFRYGEILAPVKIGEGTFINRSVYIRPNTTIGRNVNIGPFVNFVSDTHEISNTTRRAGKTSYEPIVVEDGVWIGAGATILGGVTLHRGCVVAAGAVVNKDVPPDCVVAGIPARLLKELPPLA